MRPLTPLPVHVSASVEWRSTEWKHVGRFRGSREIEVEAKRDGKPVWLPQRYVLIVVRKGEARYEFTYPMGAVISPDGLGQDRAMRALVIHGMRLDVSRHQTLPADVNAAHNRARIRVKAIVRMYREAMSQLPVSRPRKVAKRKPTKIAPTWRLTPSAQRPMPPLASATAGHSVAAKRLTSSASGGESVNSRP